MSTSEIREALENFNGWSYEKDCITKTYIFKDFVEAFGFLSKLALVSERLNHHADWSGVYNKVVLRLSTHDASGVTDKDFKFAKLADKYA